MVRFRSLCRRDSVEYGYLQLLVDFCDFPFGNRYGRSELIVNLPANERLLCRRAPLLGLAHGANKGPVA